MPEATLEARSADSPRFDFSTGADLQRSSCDDFESLPTRVSESPSSKVRDAVTPGV